MLFILIYKNEITNLNVPCHRGASASNEVHRGEHKDRTQNKQDVMKNNRTHLLSIKKSINSRSSSELTLMSFGWRILVPKASDFPTLFSCEGKLDDSNFGF